MLPNQICVMLQGSFVDAFQLFLLKVKSLPNG
jgi:hypothetical protein